MANTKSALKSIKKSHRNFVRNRSNKSSVTTIYKKCLSMIKNFDSNTQTNREQSVNDILQMRNYTYSKLDKAAKQGIYHKNKVARKKSALNREYSAMLNR